MSASSSISIRVCTYSNSPPKYDRDRLSISALSNRFQYTFKLLLKYVVKRTKTAAYSRAVNLIHNRGEHGNHHKNQRMDAAVAFTKASCFALIAMDLTSVI